VPAAPACSDLDAIRGGVHVAVSRNSPAPVPFRGLSPAARVVAGGRGRERGGDGDAAGAGGPLVPRPVAPEFPGCGVRAS
jgi:hypothetical protein